MDEQTKAFFEDLRNFPSEKDRKEAVFNSLKCILESIGSFLNDREAEFKREIVNGKDTVIYKDSYGEHYQSIEGDDPKALFIDTLKLLMRNVRELNGSYSDIRAYFEEEGK